LTDQQHVVGQLHDFQGHPRRVLDVTQRGDRTRQMRRAMHHRGIQLDDTFLVRQAAVADRRVLGVGFHAGHSLDNRLKRICAGPYQLVRRLGGGQAVGGGDYLDRKLAGLREHRSLVRCLGCCHDAVRGDRRGGEPNRRGGEEAAARYMLFGHVTSALCACPDSEGRPIAFPRAVCGSA
jgi:hypothetical protein